MMYWTEVENMLKDLGFTEMNMGYWSYGQFEQIQVFRDDDNGHHCLVLGIRAQSLPNRLEFEYAIAKLGS